jgi:hypothetical protein
VFKDADDEMGVIEKGLKRLAKKKKQAPPTPPTPAPEKKRSIFSSLNRSKK